MEERLNLFDVEVQNIRVWKLVRLRTFFSILEKMGHVNERQRTVPKSNKVIRLLGLFFNSIFYSSFSRNDEVETLVIENPRKTMLERGGYVDPFTCDFVDNLIKTESSFEVVDIGYKGRHFTKTNRFRSYGESIRYDFLFKIKQKAIGVEFSKDELNFFENIKSYIYSEFGVVVDIRSLCNQKIYEFKWQHAKFKKLFQLKNNSKVYLVCSYNKEGIIHAAQELGVEVIEFQHGVMGEFHLGYSFPNNVQIPYFPNKIKVFGRYWSESTSLPANQVEVEYYGFPYLTSKLEQYACKNKKRQVLVLSQPGNIKDLVLVTLNSCKLNPNVVHIYRLHPKERESWQSKLPELYEASLAYKNLKIDFGRSDLYTSISESSYVVGVNSAAIFEALMLNTEIILVDSPGIEYMKKLIENKHARLIKKSDNLVLSMDTRHDINIDKTYYYNM